MPPENMKPARYQTAPRCLKAPIGFEPMYSGFYDLPLYHSRIELKINIRVTWFRSRVLVIMSHTRFHCAMTRLSLLKSYSGLQTTRFELATKFAKKGV